MDPTSWNQVAINLVNHLAGHPELALVALTELMRQVGRARSGGGEAGWSLEKLAGLKKAGAGVFFIVALRIVLGGGFPFLGMLTYMLRTMA